MQINDEIINDINLSLHTVRDNGLFLSDEEISILNKYNINYLNFSSIKELIFVIQDYIDDSYDELDDLEDLSIKLSEFNYYNNTNK